MMKDAGFLVVLGAVLVAGALLLFAPLAFADEPGQPSSSASASDDYRELLESIDAKLEGLATSEDVEALTVAVGGIAKTEDVNGLSSVLEALKPMDNTQRINSLNKFMAALEGVSLFQWVTLLLLVGVCLAIVFLIAYRSHT